MLNFSINNAKNDNGCFKIFEKYRNIILEKLPKAEVILFGSHAIPMKGQINELDMLVIVDEQYDALPILKELFSEFYDYDGRIYLYDYRFDVEAEIHLVSKGHEKIKRVLGFVDLLKKNKNLREELEELKVSCNGITKEEYRDKKTEFLKRHKLI